MAAFNLRDAAKASKTAKARRMRNLSTGSGGENGDDAEEALTFLSSNEDVLDASTYGEGVRRLLGRLTAVMNFGDDLQISRMSVEQCRRIVKHMLTIATPEVLDEESMAMADSVLRFESAHSRLTDAASLTPIAEAGGCSICLWRGDITNLRVGAIVNAANSGLLGCFQPNHPCIDNAIHCGAGPRLRIACRELKGPSNRPEPTGRAQITPAFRLPSDFVLHTVGPIAQYKGHEQPELLASCYDQCLSVSASNTVRSVAFCCISTGVFGYPAAAAAKVAAMTVKAWLLDPSHAGCMDRVVFNVFTPQDLEIYRTLLPLVFAPSSPSPSVSSSPSMSHLDAAEAVASSSSSSSALTEDKKQQHPGTGWPSSNSSTTMQEVAAEMNAGMAESGLVTSAAEGSDTR